MENESLLFLYAVAIGFSIGFIFDIFRIIRLSFKHSDFLNQIEDILFWIISSLFAFYFILKLNNGEIRVYILIAAFLGTILYFNTISPLFIKVSKFLVDTIKKIVMTAIKIILTPILLVLKLLKVILKPFVNILKKQKKHLKNASSYVKIKRGKFKKNLEIILKKI